jgi:hypothetical protein
MPEDNIVEALYDFDHEGVALNAAVQHNGERGWVNANRERSRQRNINGVGCSWSSNRGRAVEARSKNAVSN